MLTTLAKKKFLSVGDANARLPLLRSILRNVIDLAVELKVRHEELFLLQSGGSTDPNLEAELDAKQRTMETYAAEIRQLGAELKDAFIGLVDFPGWLDGREVCLCWKLGEAAVEHWHETDVGFAGRRPLRSAPRHSA